MAESTEARLRKIVAEVLYVAEADLGPDTDLLSIGDSLDMVALVMRAEAEFGVEIPGDSLDAVATLGKMVQIVEAAMAAPPQTAAGAITPDDRKSLALAAASAASTVVVDLIEIGRGNADAGDLIQGEMVETLLDAAKMTLLLAQDAEPDEDRNQVLGAISRYLERRT